MKKKSVKNSNLGFTLIELLAVIIILSILLIIAIPTVTEYISNSRKTSYISTANSYIIGTKNLVNSGKLDIYDVDATYYIPGVCISMEKGENRSPFGDFLDYYIVVTYDGSGYNYYWTSRDTGNMGIYLTHGSLLKSDSVKSGVKQISTNIGVGNRIKILVLKNDCTTENADVKIPTLSIDENGAIGSDYSDSFSVVVDGLNNEWNESYKVYDDDQAKIYLTQDAEYLYIYGEIKNANAKNYDNTQLYFAVEGQSTSFTDFKYMLENERLYKGVHGGTIDHDSVTSVEYETDTGIEAKIPKEFIKVTNAFYVLEIFIAYLNDWDYVLQYVLDIDGANSKYKIDGVNTEYSSAIYSGNGNKLYVDYDEKNIYLYGETNSNFKYVQIEFRLKNETDYSKYIEEDSFYKETDTWVSILPSAMNQIVLNINCLYLI